MPAPSPPLKTISELVLWNDLQNCRCITPDVIRVIKMPSFQYFLYLREQRKSPGARSGEQAGFSNTVICLVAKISLTDSAVWAGVLSWCKFHELLAKSSGRFHLIFFTQPFQYFQIVNLADCLSSWNKLIMNNPSNIKKKVRNIVLTLNLDRLNFFGRGELAVFHCALCRFISGSYW